MYWFSHFMYYCNYILIFKIRPFSKKKKTHFRAILCQCWSIWMRRKGGEAPCLHNEALLLRDDKHFSFFWWNLTPPPRNNGHASFFWLNLKDSSKRFLAFMLETVKDCVFRFLIRWLHAVTCFCSIAACHDLFINLFGDKWSFVWCL